jgi:uncharacterized BrkB/YihY/UPF0761 family membrane protein
MTEQERHVWSETRKQGPVRFVLCSGVLRFGLLQGILGGLVLAIGSRVMDGRPLGGSYAWPFWLTMPLGLVGGLIFGVLVWLVSEHQFRREQPPLPREHKPDMFRRTIWGGTITAAVVMAACLAVAYARDEKPFNPKAKGAAMAFARGAVPVGALAGGIAGYWLGAYAKRKKMRAAPDRPCD